MGGAKYEVGVSPWKDGLMATIREQAEFVAMLNGEREADVFAWLTSVQFGRLEEDDNDE